MIDYLNVPEEMLDRPIEPWEPKVGDRVRIVLNGECKGIKSKLGSRFDRHQPEEGGLIGIVVEPSVVEDNEFTRTHPYLVKFMGFSHGIWGAIYAACELEPLTDEAC